MSDSCPIGTLSASTVCSKVPPRPEECQLFNMEAEVDKLELMFQKADSDLDYIQYRLEYEIKMNYPDSAGKKNPVTLIKELSAIKSRYQTLHARIKTVANEQKETKGHIFAALNKTMTVIQELQKQTDLELSPLSKEEITAGEQLNLTCLT